MPSNRAANVCFLWFRFKVPTAAPGCLRAPTGFPSLIHYDAVNSNPRQLQLVEEVRARQSTSVEHLAEILGVTLQTVRRDIQKLADAGLLVRFHGGVRVPSATVENLAHTQRQVLHAEGKMRIARAIAEAIPNGCSLILNIGGSCS